MKATDILSSEHRVIERVIHALEQGADRLEQGQPVQPEFFLQAADFIRGFADGCHHRKEEGVLFRRLVKAGMSVHSGPVGVMLAEHEQGRAFTSSMRVAAKALQCGDAEAAVEVVRNARGYASLLRQHIQKEDQVLFPMAGRLIPVEEHEALLAGFETVEHEETGEGIHEKYLALAETLEKEMAA